MAQERDVNYLKSNGRTKTFKRADRASVDDSLGSISNSFNLVVNSLEKVV